MRGNRPSKCVSIVWAQLVVVVMMWVKAGVGCSKGCGLTMTRGSGIVRMLNATSCATQKKKEKKKKKNEKKRKEKKTCVCVCVCVCVSVDS